MLHAAGMVEVKQAVNLGQVPAQTAGQFGLFHALRQHLGVDGKFGGLQYARPDYRLAAFGLAWYRQRAAVIYIKRQG